MQEEKEGRRGEGLSASHIWMNEWMDRDNLQQQ